MEPVRFFHWQVELDPGATAAAYRRLSTRLDPSCCSACATFLLAAEREVLPAEVLSFLASAAADLRNPQEVWGAPDAGFLSGWWVFAGQIESGEWTGGAANAYAEPAPGFRCWLTGELAMAPPPAFAGGHPLVQFEFEWEHPLLPELEHEAWPSTPATRPSAQPADAGDEPAP